MNLRDSFLQQLSSAHTRRAYRTDLLRFFGEEDLDDSDVESVRTEEIRSFIRSMHERGRSESTQRRRIAALRRFFDWVVDRGIRASNPVRAQNVHPLSDQTSDGSSAALSKEDVLDLLEVASQRPRSGLRDQALILTIIYAAVRRSEVAALTVEDVRPLGRHWIIDLPSSSAASGGYVRIPETVVEAIEIMKTEYEITEGPLWRSLSNRNRNEPMSPDAIYKVVRSVGENAGIRGVSIDRLRRTGLHLALRGGADVPTVQAHGRFTSPTTVAHLHDDDRPSGRLRTSVADFIDLDLGEIGQSED